MNTFRLDEDTANLIEKLFNVPLFRTHVQNVIDEQLQAVNGRIWIDYQLVAQVNGWWLGTVTVAQMLYSHSRRKSILLAKKDESFLGYDPGRFVETSDWADPIAESLKSMNLYEEPIGVVPGNETHPHIQLMLVTTNGTRTIDNYGSGGMKDPTWIQLWEALLQTIRSLQVEYSDPDLDQFLDNPFSLKWFTRVPAEGFMQYLDYPKPIKQGRINK